MCPFCISTATWFVGTTLLPAALAAMLVKIPRPSDMAAEVVSAPPTVLPSNHSHGKETQSHA
jgi:hypothetical protein